MANRKKRRRSRSSSFLIPTLAIVVVSLAAALAAVVYWDKQEEISSGETEPVEQQVSQEEGETPDSETEKAVLSKEEVPIEETNENEEKIGNEEAEEIPEVFEAGVPEGEEVDPAYFSDAVFVGDSLTQGIQLYKIIDTTVLANKGINLQSIYKTDKIRVSEGYTGVLPELERIQPNKIYVQLGMNDIAWRTKGDFIKLYGELIDEIRTTVPDSIIYIQSVFPVTGWYSEKDNGIDNAKIIEYNKSLFELAEEKECYFLNVHSALIDENGVLPDSASPDGIHLQADYYQRWFTYLKTHVV